MVQSCALVPAYAATAQSVGSSLSPGSATVPLVTLHWSSFVVPLLRCMMRRLWSVVVVDTTVYVPPDSSLSAVCL